jgi:hypothetical protein
MSLPFLYQFLSQTHIATQISLSNTADAGIPQLTRIHRYQPIASKPKLTKAGEFLTLAASNKDRAMPQLR